MAFGEPINPALLGTDIATSPSGDVAAAGRDWGTISGVQNVVNAFIRELVTPLGYLARYVYDVGGLKIVDETYGDGAYAQLSEPLTPNWINNQIDHIRDVADSQPRITLLAVDYEITNEEHVGVVFNIKFEVLGTPKPLNMLLRKIDNTLTAGLVGG